MQTLIDDVAGIVATGGPEQKITSAVWDMGQGTPAPRSVRAGWARAKWSHAVRGGATLRVSSGRAPAAR